MSNRTTKAHVDTILKFTNGQLEQMGSELRLEVMRLNGGSQLTIEDSGRTVSRVCTTSEIYEILNTVEQILSHLKWDKAGK